MSSTFLAVRLCTLPLAVQTRDVGILWRQVGDTSPANRGLEEERWRREVDRDLESSVAVIFSLTTMLHPVKAHDAIVYLSGTNITRCCRKNNLYFTLFSIYIVLYFNISTVKRKKNVIYHSIQVLQLCFISSSSSCHQTSAFHVSTHFFVVSLNLLMLPNEKGCARRVHCIMCAVFSVARPHSQVVSSS